jgi:hypothetical protein
MKTISISIAMILMAGAITALLPLSLSTASADNICKFNSENQRCDLDIDKVTGGFKLSIINEQNNGGGGSGNVSTVDQQARDAIAQNDINDVAVNGSVTSLTGVVNGLLNEIADLKADIQTLNNSAVTGISLSNGSAVVTPPGPEPVVCEPPAILNSTTNQCETPIVVIPPVNDTGNGQNNGSENNGTGNGTEFGNFTG